MKKLTNTDLLKAVRGSYQYGLLFHKESWSGSSLRGAAKRYSRRYAASRSGLVRRMQAMFPDHTIECELVLINSRWRRVLVVDGEVW